MKGQPLALLQLSKNHTDISFVSQQEFNDIMLKPNCIEAITSTTREIIFENVQDLDFSELAEALNLYKLSFKNNCTFTSVAQLTNIPKTVRHICFENVIGSLINLPQYIKIVELNAKQKLPELPANLHLQELHTYALDVSKLQQVESLCHLIISPGTINSFTQIQGLNNLKINKLTIKANKITSLNDLKLYGLQYLDLSFNEISSLNGIDKFQQMQELNVGYNQIQNGVEGLLGLQQLKKLQINSNQLLIDQTQIIESIKHKLELCECQKMNEQKGGFWD
ncbi:Conserved_hypothetical protein [Hexamita inflata]|uniref:Uncharacterized protein n=1 Tax=Hexamita inflata TaxID=28002 RepID=A0ABP1GXE3_9EUKA